MSSVSLCVHITSASPTNKSESHKATELPKNGSEIGTSYILILMCKKSPKQNKKLELLYQQAAKNGDVKAENPFKISSKPERKYFKMSKISFKNRPK